MNVLVDSFSAVVVLSLSVFVYVSERVFVCLAFVFVFLFSLVYRTDRNRVFCRLIWFSFLFSFLFLFAFFFLFLFPFLFLFLFLVVFYVFYPQDVPVLSDGIYHIDSFVLDAPKSGIFVGLQDDYKLRYSPDHCSGHENIMALDINDDHSCSSSAGEDHSDSDTSQVDANSINCCTAYPVDDTLAGPTTIASHDGVFHFDNDEFIIVPQVPQKLITSHCNLHSGLAIMSPPSSMESGGNSPASRGTDSLEAELNYQPPATAFSLSIYPDTTRTVSNQSFIQKCVQ